MDYNAVEVQLGSSPIARTLAYKIEDDIIHPMDKKICGNCDTEKLVTEFARKRGKYSSKCKTCHNKYYQEYWKNTEAYEKHKGRQKQRKRDKPWYERARKYGLTENQVIELLNANNGKCLICNVEPAKCIDHCHETLVVRGALCGKCNSGLGMFNDKIEYLQSAIDYLKIYGKIEYTSR